MVNAIVFNESLQTPCPNRQKVILDGRPPGVGIVDHRVGRRRHRSIPGGGGVSAGRNSTAFGLAAAARATHHGSVARVRGSKSSIGNELQRYGLPVAVRGRTPLATTAATPTCCATPVKSTCPIVNSPGPARSISSTGSSAETAGNRGKAQLATRQQQAASKTST